MGRKKKPEEFVEIRYNIASPRGLWCPVTGKAVPGGSFAYRHLRHGHWSVDHMMGRFSVAQIKGKEVDAQEEVRKLEGYKAQAEVMRRDNPDQRGYANQNRKGKKRNGPMQV